MIPQVVFHEANIPQNTLEGEGGFLSKCIWKNLCVHLYPYHLEIYMA